MSEAANVVWYGITLAVFVLIALYGAIVYGNMREANAYRKLTAEATHGLATTAKAVMRDPPGWVPKPPTDPSVAAGLHVIIDHQEKEIAALRRQLDQIRGIASAEPRHATTKTEPEVTKNVSAG